jgi:hypothetical protein
MVKVVAGATAAAEGALLMKVAAMEVEASKTAEAAALMERVVAVAVEASKAAGSR